MIAYALALLAGMATIGSPCILPVLPIVLATTAGRSKAEPLLIIAGFVATFAAGGILIGALSASSGELQQSIRTASVLLLLIAGLACLWTAPFDWLVQQVRQLAVVRRSALSWSPTSGGRVGALLVGASLGLAWTPCAGPILASMLALAASAQASGKAIALLGTYALGAGIPMLAIAYGGSWVSSRLGFFHRRAGLFRQMFGAIAIAVAVLQLLQYDVAVTAWATQWLPSFSTGL
ncbi:cytochrome c biogenesis protein CcdA [Luteibacter sp. Sphag1AF]|uniref:cytochrome c biogenesis CcdA family protein n=1 Tax=Luteibacter sp. Sphag1AF TaxID=2587031 RepID=UPI00161919C9|nr:cytochrome c biogenesis protein CcdA [Luteibacter sp. Sphag1AF]MBB3228152.1 cytochrome c biogenesis protein CcdA [Luteibacter sp. Sphag1AF]